MFKIFSTYIYWINKKNAASVGLRCGTTTKVAVRRQMVNSRFVNITVIMFSNTLPEERVRLSFVPIYTANRQLTVPLRFQAPPARLPSPHTNDSPPFPSCRHTDDAPRELLVYIYGS